MDSFATATSNSIKMYLLAKKHNVRMCKIYRLFSGFVFKIRNSEVEVGQHNGTVVVMLCVVNIVMNRLVVLKGSAIEMIRSSAKG